MIPATFTSTGMASHRLAKGFIILLLFGTAFILMLLTKWTGLVPAQQLRLTDSSSSSFSSSSSPTREQTIIERGFLLDSTDCKIPDIDPFDPVTLQDLPGRGSVLCTGRPSITYVEGSFLRLNRTRIRVEYDGDFKYCQYQPLARGPKNSDFAFVYSDLSDRFNDDIRVPPEHEFMRVYCYSKSEGRISTNFHAAVTPKVEVEMRSSELFMKHMDERKPKEVFNLHMIGVDSVSRLNFIRQMPRTREFLLQELRAFEMSGYNKIADNTFVNIIPMMMGKLVSEIGWNETMVKKPFDEYNFFWKNFSEAGYRTLYAEDAPNIAIFVYSKEGFHTPPADYYNRPLALAMEKHRSVWSRDHHCLADRLETTMLLNYVTDFSRVFKAKPHFGFTFITRLTHDSINLAGAADAPYLKFFKRFRKESHFDNTIIIFYSDHGYRFGGNRNTYVGKVEERLPFMYLIFPPKFHKKYPKLVTNLRLNSRRLTTPFDVFETLKDILYFDGVDREANVKNRGISLLREIPKERNCEHAQILPHWCLCLQQNNINPTSKLAMKIGRALVRQINDALSPAYHLCSRLKLENITYVVEMESNDKVLRFEDSFHDVINRTVVYGDKTEAPIIYQITLHTLPSHALFEATLTYDKVYNIFKLAGDVSRINAYSDQSKCIDNFKLKKFCFCDS